MIDNLEKMALPHKNIALEGAARPQWAKTNIFCLVEREASEASLPAST